MIKKFESFRNTVEEQEFYKLGDDIVYITSIQYFGDQMRVEYIERNGNIDFFIGDDTRDLEEHFKTTSERFSLKQRANLKKKTPELNQGKTRSKSKSKYNKDIDRYNVEEYSGKRHTATKDYNLPLKQAMARIKDYNYNPTHKGLTYKLKKL
jgi:hypothetical protein